MGKVSAVANALVSTGDSNTCDRIYSRFVGGGDKVEIFDPEDEGQVWPRYGMGKQRE